MQILASVTLVVMMSPCMILRENLYRHYADRPAWIMERVGECIMNHQRLRIQVLTDAEEVKKFRDNVYIAPGGHIVESDRKQD